MLQQRPELLSRLRATVGGWKAEVTAAHQGLVERIADAQDQLDRVIEIIAHRERDAEALGRAQAEIEALRIALQRGVTTDEASRLAVGASQDATAAFRNRLLITAERVASAITAWKAEVCGAQQGLTRQISQTGAQLDRLLSILGPSDTAAPVQDDRELERIREELASNQATRERLEDELDQVLRLLQDRERALAEASREREEYQARANQLAETLDRLEADRERVSETARSHETAFEELRRQAAAREAALGAELAQLRVTAESRADIDALREEIEREHAAFEEADRERVALREALAELDGVRNEKHALEEEIAAREAELAALQAQLMELRESAQQQEDARERDAEIASLKRSLADREGETTALIRRIADFEAEAIRWKQMVEKLDAEAESMRSRLDQRNEEVERLNAGAEQASEVINLLQMDLDTAQRRAEESAVQARTLRQQVELLSSDKADSLDRYMQDFEGLRGKLDALQAEKEADLAALRNELAARDESLTALQEYAGSLAEQLAARQDAEESAVARAGELAAALEQAQTTAAGLETLLLERDAGAGELRERLSALEENLASAAARETALTVELEDARERLRREWDQRTDANSELLQLIEERDTTLRERENALGEARAKEADLQNQLADLNAAHAQRLAELEAATTAQAGLETLTEELRAKADAAAVESERLSGECDRLRDECDALRAARENALGDARAKEADLERQLADLNAAHAQRLAELEAATTAQASLETLTEELRAKAGAAAVESERLSGECDRLRDECDALRAQRDAAVHERDEMRPEFDGLRGLVMEREAELDGLRGELAERVRMLAARDEQLRDAEARTGAIEAELARVREEKDAFAATLSANFEQLRAERAAEATAIREAHAAALAERDASVSELRQEMEQLVHELESLRGQEDVTSGRAAQLAESFAELLTEKQAQDRRLDEAFQTIEAQHAELTARTAALEAAQGRVRELEARLAEAAGREQELVKRLEETDAALREQAEKQQEQMAVFQQTLDAKQAELDTRDTSTDDLRTSLTEFEQQIRALREREKAVSLTVEELSQQLEHKRREETARGEALEQTQHANLALSNNLAEQVASMASLRSLNLELQEKLDQTRAREGQLSVALRDTRAALEKTAERERSVNAALAETRAALAQAQKELESREKGLRERDTVLAKAQTEFNAIRQALNDKTAAFETLQAELHALKKAHAELSEAFSRAQVAVRDRDTALSERDIVIDRLREQAAGLESDLGRARERADEKPRVRVAPISDFPEEFEAEARRRKQKIVVTERVSGSGRRALGEILVNADVITPRQLSFALKEQKRNPKRLLGTILIEHELATEDAIAQAVASQLGLPLIELNAQDVDRKAAELLNKELCAWHVCMPVRVKDGRLVVAMANPLDDTALKKIADIARQEPVPVVATTSHIINTIEDVYGF